MFVASWYYSTICNCNIPPRHQPQSKPFLSCRRKKCYLKNQENYQNFVLKERYTKQDEYISGVKHCDPMEEEISRNNNNLRVFIHGHQLKALYANFGRQIHPGIKVSMHFFCGMIQREIYVKTGSTLR